MADVQLKAVPVAVTGVAAYSLHHHRQHTGCTTTGSIQVAPPLTAYRLHHRWQHTGYTTIGSIQVTPPLDSIQVAPPLAASSLHHHWQHTGCTTIDLCCMQLTAEGGWDAAQEAPFLYAAIDALAARAGTWAERQQRLRIESASKQAASEMAEPVVISRQAIAFVKQVKAVSQIAVFVSKPVLCLCPFLNSLGRWCPLPSCYIPALPRPLPLIYLFAFL